jgi:hypothetical protein
MENEKFPNFDFISNCITHGMMILVKKHIPILEHMHFKEQNVEALLAKVIVHESQIAILNIYVVPHAILTNIMNAIAKALHHLHLKKSLSFFETSILTCYKAMGKQENYKTACAIAISTSPPPTGQDK